MDFCFEVKKARNGFIIILNSPHEGRFSPVLDSLVFESWENLCSFLVKTPELGINGLEIKDQKGKDSK